MQLEQILIVDSLPSGRETIEWALERAGVAAAVLRDRIGVVRHHGAIAVESAPGEGTTVTVRLPTDCRIHASPSDEPVAGVYSVDIDDVAIGRRRCCTSSSPPTTR